MNCEFCQSPVHIWFQCPKKPDGWKPARLVMKSTAARKDVRQPTPGYDGGVGSASRNPRSAERSGPVHPQAGTQALPVDTNPERPVVVFTVTDHGSSEAPSAGTGEDKDRQPKFDKKTWMREYMREHRKGLRRRGTGN